MDVVNGHGANATVLRVLSDLDAGSGPGDRHALFVETGSGGDGVSMADGKDILISDILAEMVKEDQVGDGPGPRYVPLDAFERRRLDVTIARAERYLRATDAVATASDATPSLERRIGLGRSLLGCLMQMQQAEGGRHNDPATAMIEAGRALGADLASLLPVECDVDVPTIPSEPVGVFLKGLEKHPDGEGVNDDGFSQAWAELHARVVSRANVVAEARSAWPLGTALLVEVRRLDAPA